MEIIVFEPKQRPRRIEAPTALPAEGFLWMDFDREIEPEWYRVIAELTGIQVHERHIQDSLNLAHPSYFDGVGDYDMLIFRSLAPETEEGEFATRPTAFFLFDRLLVSVRPADSRSVGNIKRRVLESNIRLPSSPASLLHLILNAMIDRFLAMREPLTEVLDAWRDALLDPHNPFSDWHAVLEYRKQLRKLEMLCESQEDALTEWRDLTTHEVTEHLAVRYNDLVEHIRRVFVALRFGQGREARQVDEAERRFDVRCRELLLSHAAPVYDNSPSVRVCRHATRYESMGVKPTPDLRPGQ
ncbi:MAG: CorA family divalent cation transporter [Pseudolabrys sp.]